MGQQMISFVRPLILVRPPKAATVCADRISLAMRSDLPCSSRIPDHCAPTTNIRQPSEPPRVRPG
jgi:hypothetical protein